MEPSALLGTWQLRRRLRDRRADVGGVMIGTLVLTPVGADILWDEAGTLRWAGQDVRATRSYLLRPTAAGSWWVHFQDGRPFHPWTPEVMVSHLCRADLYRGLVSIGGPNDWRVLWDVTGPEKRQRVLTRLTRRAQGTGVTR